ncbi:MAG TPA: hydroxypyruvate isomerase [Polyangiaceae bacterium]|nr:hydroxypyruvate isomerase [Polyangiaceae bacterium]
MIKLAANLTFLFNEVEFLGRFEAAARAGFRGVEYLFPYAYEKRALVEHLGVHDLTQVLFNLPPGDFAAGERGIACLPDRVGEFQDGVGMALDYAKALGCRQLNCLAGILGGNPEAAHRTLVDNLKFASRELGLAGIRLNIEPINTRDIPGFFLRRTEQALRIIDEVGASNLFLQYDIYHMQIMEGDLAATLERSIGKVAHVQLADNPGRHEPGTGEINYPFLFRRLRELGYDGWIGCEYKPSSSTAASLSWIDAYRDSLGG